MLPVGAEGLQHGKARLPQSNSDLGTLCFRRKDLAEEP